MARPKQSIIEYRSYDFPGSLPVQIHNRMNWSISSVKSSRLHIHNCFEIGLCLSGSGKMNFGEEDLLVGKTRQLPRCLLLASHSSRDQSFAFIVKNDLKM